MSAEVTYMIEPPNPATMQIVAVRFSKPMSKTGVSFDKHDLDSRGDIEPEVRSVLSQLFETGEVESIFVHPHIGWRISLRRAKRRGRLVNRLKRILEPIAQPDVVAPPRKGN